MGGERYRPLIEDMVWSYSRINCYIDCPYRWFVKYIHTPKIEEEPMFYTTYGSFMHKLIERYYKKEITRDQMRVEFLINFSREVMGDRPSEKIVGDYIKSGLDYIESFRDLPYNIIGVEKTMNFSIEGKQFVGIVDILGEKDGNLYIIDNKSRNLKPRSKRKKPTVSDKELDEMLKQLYVYATAVKQTYGEFPKALCFNCFRNNVFIEEDFNMDTYESVIEEVVNTIRRIEDSESDDFHPNIDYFYCNYLCGYHNSCEYMNR